MVAVDESPDMFARIRDTVTLCATIEHLDLDQLFDVVLLASFLVSVPGDAIRRAVLASCRRHAMTRHGGDPTSRAGVGQPD